MHMSVFLNVVHARRGDEILWDGVTDNCETPCRCWELNPGSLEEQPVLSTLKQLISPSTALLCSANSASDLNLWGLGMCHSMCQRTTCRDWFSPSTTWVPLCHVKASAFTPLSHLVVPKRNFTSVSCLSIILSFAILWPTFWWWGDIQHLMYYFWASGTFFSSVCHYFWFCW